MVLRKCTVCDRRFTKTEHFKRHERSRQSIPLLYPPRTVSDIRDRHERTPVRVQDLSQAVCSEVRHSCRFGIGRAGGLFGVEDANIYL